MASVEGLAPGCLDSKMCPIGGGTCPGEPCVYASIMESVGLGIVVFEVAKDRLIFCNHWATETLVGLGPVDFVSLSRLLLAPGAPPVNSVAQPPPLRIGSRLVGYTVYYGDRFAWVFLRDITEKARLESIAEAVETMNNIGYVFSAVRHEIGNPLNSLKVALSVLESNLERFPQQTVLEYIQRMSSEVGRIENLLRSLRTYSLFEQPEARNVDAYEFVVDFLRLVRPELDRRGIQITHDPCQGISIHCDPRALNQVLLNLIANSSDALVGRASPSIALRCTTTDALVLIRIADNGCGIPTEEQHQLFKPFHTTKATGTGLGLVIARKLLAAMNGTITVESTGQEGTTFLISVPIGMRLDSGDPVASDNR